MTTVAEQIKENYLQKYNHNRKFKKINQIICQEQRIDNSRKDSSSLLELKPR